jgi:hypothetical protein
MLTETNHQLRKNKNLAWFLLLITASVLTMDIQAQTLTLDAVTLNLYGHRGDPEIPAYQSFIANSREPALFGSLAPLESNPIPEFQSTNLEIEFHLRLNEAPENLIVIGLLNSTSTTQMYSISNADSSLASGDLSLQNRRQHFKLRSGYMRKFRADRKFSLYVGASLDVAIPISSENIVSEAGNEDQVIFRFFGKRALSYGLNIPIGFHLKLFRGTYLNINSMPAFYWNYLDGSSSFHPASGLRLGFAFRLNDIK